MKRIIGIGVALIFALGASAATDATKSDTSTKPAAAPAPKTIQPLTIPKDAKPAENGTYKYTDKDGKKWIYSVTPFGVSRVEDMSAVQAAAQPSAPVPVRMVDLGDTVRFEQPGPFGIMRSEKKKSDLTDDERKTLESQKQQTQKAEQK